MKRKWTPLFLIILYLLVWTSDIYYGKIIAMITQEYLKSLLSYDPQIGMFTWLVSSSPTARAGQWAGCLDSRGYAVVRINKTKYYVHRLVWLYFYGRFPVKHIDHINGVRNDNRIVNLRLATQTENLYNTAIYSNNTSGFKGVSWNKTAKKWLACTKVGGKYKYLGLFDIAKEASEAYQEFAKQHHGEFYNRGNVAKHN